jgi:hypothetical protein
VLFILCAMARGAQGAPIPGWRPSINYTGFDPSPMPFTYGPIANGQFKPEYANAVATLLDPSVGRAMDLLQNNDNAETTWPTRATTDFGPGGITRETDIRIANQMRGLIPDYIPQTHFPARSDIDYARQLGRLWGTMYGGHTVRVANGNELWNVFAGNNGAYNLEQAKAEGYVGDDFRILGLRQGVQLALKSKAFKQGLEDVGRSDVTVVTVIEGLAPVAQYARNQIDGMRSIGVEPASINARLAIAQYAFGTSTDVAGRPIGTDAQKRDAVIDFVNKSLVAWTLDHRALARANWLPDVVDSYEFRLATKPVQGQAETDDWVHFQLTDENAQAQDAGIRALVTASGGVGAALALEGLYGFPMDAPQGQFPLLALDQFNDPFASGAFRGVHGLIDFTAAIPEPNGSAVAVALAAIVLAGRKGKEH